MKNSILYIVGAVALLGGGAFLFLKNKKAKDASKLADLEKLKVVEQAQVQAHKQETTNNITVYRIKKVYMYMAIF